MLLAGHANRLIGNTNLARNFYHRANLLAATMTELSDYAILATIYDQLCVYSTGNNREPLECLVPLLEQSLNAETSVILHQSLGNIYRSAANWHSSKKHFKEAIRLAKLNNYTCKAMECRAELGRAYRSSGCHSKALKRQEKFLQFAVSRGDVYSTAAACGYVGFTYFSMGSKFYDEATKYLYSKLKLSKCDLDDASGYRWCLNNLGKVYLELKEYNVCIQLFTESAKIARELGNTLGLGTAYGNLGSACRAIDKHEEAIRYHKLYLDIAKHNSDTGGVAIMQRELILDHLYLYKSQCSGQERDIWLMTARKYAVEALKTSLEVRSRLGKEDDMLKIGHFEHNQAKIYSLLLFILVQQNLHEVSLVVSELGRAHALADRVREKFLVESEFTVEMLTVLGDDNEINASAVSVLKDKINTMSMLARTDVLAYSLLEDPLSKDRLIYTWYITSHDKKLQIHFKQTIANESRCLPHSSLFSEDYCRGLLREIGIADDDEDDDELVSEIKSCGISASVKSRDIIRRKIVKPVPKDSERNEKKSLLEEAYDELVLPMVQYMTVSSSQIAKLIIIPHGTLFHVPFCALKHGGHHLIEDFVISISPSLYMWDINLQRELKWSKQKLGEEVKLLAVGNPTMPAKDLQLPGAEEEVKSIASLVGSTTVLCGPEATKQAVLSGFSDYSVIHLATHAILESSLNSEAESTPNQYNVGNYEMKGAIILAKSDESCSGVLTSSEIETLKVDPSCELVVLNCCNTGKGTVTGDGVLGLSRSLMCAGVLSMIVTLWRIEDKSAALLMKQFYRLYKENRDAPKALHDSMLYMIKHGYGCKKWAAFCCIGAKNRAL